MKEESQTHNEDLAHRQKRNLIFRGKVASAKSIFQCFFKEMDAWCQLINRIGQSGGSFWSPWCQYQGALWPSLVRFPFDENNDHLTGFGFGVYQANAFKEATDGSRNRGTTYLWA